MAILIIILGIISIVTIPIICTHFGVCLDVLSYLSTIGTLILAILAIWGDWVRSKLAAPILIISAHNLQGQVIPTNLYDSKGNYTKTIRRIYYHLKVVNLRKWTAVKKCSVQLISLKRKAINGEFVELQLIVPHQFTWTPAEYSLPYQDFIGERIFDFGHIDEDSPDFCPSLLIFNNSFNGFVSKGEVLRYELKVIADNYFSTKSYIWEVAWDGLWTDNTQTMSQHLIIKEIKATSD